MVNSFFRIISRLQPSPTQSNEFITKQKNQICLSSFNYTDENSRNLKQQQEDLNTEKEAIIKDSIKNKLAFTFDEVSFSSSQNSFYQNYVKYLVQSFNQGRNCSIFLFGAESAGLKYTFQGDLNDMPKLGLIPRIALDLLMHLSKQEKPKKALFMSTTLV